MKTLLKLCLIGTSLFCACRKEAVNNEQSSLDEPTIRETFGNFLEFRDEDAFQTALQESRARTPDEQLMFEQNNQFVSMKTRFNEFTNKVDEMERKKDSSGFQALKNAYAAAVCWPEEGFPIINTANLETGALVNADGFVKIGDKLLKLEYDRKIELRNTTSDIISQAIQDSSFGQREGYSIIKMKHPGFTYINDGVSIKSSPGYAWLDITNSNPSEGNFVESSSNWYILQSGTRRLDARLLTRNIRVGGILYAFVTIEHRAWEKQLIGWKFVWTTDLKINGAMRIDYPLGGGFYGIYTKQYNNTHIEDFSYEHEFSWVGSQIIAISEKLLNHPNPSSIPGNHAHNRTQDIYDYPENWRLLINDEGPTGQDMQAVPGYHLYRFRSGSAFNPTAYLRVDGTINNATLSINF